ncbi:hypothetical protein AJ79_06363 [Helicocarpus griseus UAMH5409]|uniref:Zn(2)-C6 fungal-type domain-containing protein n=1 Tax=Helicocarpus griseus UAMH5409 TaxID=1447875 RepID=A0A2B7XDR6_9EURO|nr:hypothetical protein AJ79_06363 [Helicocarpus griseus UAMH5409]
MEKGAPEKNAHGKQVVFRFKKPPAQPRGPKQLPAQNGGDLSEGTAYHSRKSHKKSRAGCINCKKRRIKCDETKPGCRRCETYGVDCVYLPPKSSPNSQQLELASRPKSNSPDGYFQSMSAMDMACKIEQLLWHGDVFVPGTARIQAYESLHIFITSLSEKVPAPGSFTAVIKGDMIRVAFQTPYLMHAILGLSNGFFAWTFPGSSRYKLLEARHLSMALQLYKKELAWQITKENMDGLISTCMLLSDVPLLETECSPYDSFVFSSDPSAMNWLLLQSGVSRLLPYVNTFLHQSIWFAPFMETYELFLKHKDCRSGREGLHPELADLCEIDDASTSENNPYHEPLRTLMPILNMELNSKNFVAMVSFMGTLKPNLISLLQKREPRALLILAFWLGKMCSDQCSWIYRKLHTECVAICMYLENSSDWQILELLAYPASSCGYVLKHMRE